MNYVVIDLEMCDVPYSRTNGEYRWGQEIIQIGAVLVNGKFEITEKFSSYVKPKIGDIDNYINRLTEISRYNVKDAPLFEEAMGKFISWLPDIDDYRFVSWSTNDRKQIQEEALYKHMDLECLADAFDEWIDAQAIFGEKIGSKRDYSLEEALIASDIYQEGNAHDGLDDAYNTAKLFIKLETEPVFRLNETYRSATEDDVEHLSFTLGDIFSSIKI